MPSTTPPTTRPGPPDPAQLDWRPPEAENADSPSDPRNQPGWAAALPEAAPAERAVVERQIGRPVRGSIAVAARCRFGLPAVVRTAPYLDDGTPFPTLYWLTCPAGSSACTCCTPTRSPPGPTRSAGWPGG